MTPETQSSHPGPAGSFPLTNGVPPKNDWESIRPVPDSAALSAALRSAITGEVRFDDGSRALYATDASNYRQSPLGVVIPKTVTDIEKTMALCRKFGAPVLSRGGGTSLAGQCCNVAVVMDMTKYYNKVLHIDREKKLVTVQPGIVLDEMKKITEREAGLTFGPDPATHDHCAIGGMLGNNSCGSHSVMAAFAGYGARMSDNVESMVVLTYDGIRMKVGPTPDPEYRQILSEGGRKADIYRSLRELGERYADLIRKKFPDIPRRVSGYNLPDLLEEHGFNLASALVGTEGTCVTILEATLRLLEPPGARSMVVLGYPDVFEAGSHVAEIMKHRPIALEGIDNRLIGFMKKKGLNMEDLSLLPEGKGWLMVEFGGDDKAQADARASGLMAALKKAPHCPHMSLFDRKDQEKKLWEIRESGLGATAWVPDEPMGAPGWDESAVSPERVGEYLLDRRKLFDQYGYKPSLYGHFGQGCIHCRVQFDLFTREGIEKYQSFTQEAARLVVRYGGSLSGEHGDGQARADLLEIMFGSELVEAFRKFKRIWDPWNKMNPGKIVDSYGQLSGLRISNHYSPPLRETVFHFPEDDQKFSHTVIRCVGVGKCRHHEGGTMCPSYMVTREEKHSTRGRARMLFEMMDGKILKKGWKSREVKESLDLCLSCKGCKEDCPVNVDMATYKAEFLSHYYRGSLRPRTAYFFGLIFRWARIATLAPGLVNFLTRNRMTAPLIKLLAGVDPRRSLPQFSRQTFRQWFLARKPSDPRDSRPRVILWPDTFNNFFLPETLKAAWEVLDAAGFRVVLPSRVLCCGRPLYDFGMLRKARSLILEILDHLKEDIEEGTPIVGLEPSCVAVFRDELCNLFPGLENASRLKSQTYTLAEFLEKKAPGFPIPSIRKQLIVHGHCHHKAIMKMKEYEAILKKTGAAYRMPDSGCCGMAGYFGYEKGEHYEVSVKAGERVLLPAVRESEADTLIVADGFSCREQIEQLTGRKPIHLAELLRQGLHQASGGQP